MTKEEEIKRKKSTEYSKLNVTKAKDKKPYVFISYRSSSWETVLTKIVYKLQKTYGLRIYFDKDFATLEDPWIDQFTVNMESVYCKAMLCFMDDGYFTSYATLLELMHAKNRFNSNSEEEVGAIIPVNFDIHENMLKSDDDTGLGKDDIKNPAWKDELEQFRTDFKLISKKSKYEDIIQYFSITREWKARKYLLSKKSCYEIVKRIQPQNLKDYYDGESFYSELITLLRNIDKRDTQLGSIFEDPDKVDEIIKNGGKLDNNTNTDTSEGATSPAPKQGENDNVGKDDKEIDDKGKETNPEVEVSSKEETKPDVPNIGTSVGGTKPNPETSENGNGDVSPDPEPDGNISVDPLPPVPPVEPQPVDIYYHYKAAGGYSVVKKNALDTYYILKGSKWSPKEKAYRQQERDELVKNHVVENGVFKQDYPANSPSEAARLISGTSTSGPGAFTDERIVTKEQAEKILAELNINTNQTTSDDGTDHVSNEDEDIYYHFHSPEGDAIIKKSKENYYILPGSKWAPVRKDGRSTRESFLKENPDIVKDGVFVKEYCGTSPSQAAKLVTGNSISVKVAYTDKRIVTKEQAERILPGLQNTDNEPAVSNAEEKASGDNSIHTNRLI